MSAQLLDVSNWNSQAGEPFNWEHAKAVIPNLVGGIFRLTQGLGGPGTGSPDLTAQANHHVLELRRLGLWAAAYHFMDPALDGGEQAAYFVDEYRKIDMRDTDGGWLDNETAKAGISAHQTSLVAQAFMTEKRKLVPYQPGGVYTFIDFAKYGYCAGLEHEALWLAFPAAKAPMTPMPWTHWTFWQYGNRDGVDADAFNGDTAEFDAWVKSFAPKDPSGPTEHTLTGLETLGDFCRKMGTTVPIAVRETLARTQGDLSHGQRRLLDHLDTVRPEPGTKIWVP